MRETEAPAICESSRRTATPSRYGKARLSSTLREFGAAARIVPAK